MKKYSLVKYFVIVFFGLAQSFGAIYSAEQRKTMVEDGRRVLGRTVVFVDENLANKLAIAFGDLTGVVEEVEEDSVELPPAELIRELAEQIHPTGVFSVNGDFYLILKEKRIKAGGYLPVRYLGREYNLLLSEVVRNAFTVKFGGEELQIKLK